MTLGSEATDVHTRLLKCALEVEDARAYWTHGPQAVQATAQRAFDEYWFGARSLARVEVLLTNMRARFGVFPAALATLHRWPHMAPDTRRVICHWHLQLSDPLYRRFTGSYLVERHHNLQPHVTRDLVIDWVGQQGPGRWTMATRIQFASKLLSAAHAADLITSSRDPRPLGWPAVSNEALEYLLYLLRETRFEGSLVNNPYVASVGLEGPDLDYRVRALPGLAFRRQGPLLDFGWRYPDLQAWADANLRAQPLALGAS